MKKTYHSKISAAIHETMADLHRTGAVDDRTMRKFDELCLTPVKELSPRQIKAIRTREHTSQAVFARFLNVTTGLVSQWERGEKKPGGASLKLLTLVKNKGLDAVA